jgi:hypothetical protein
MYYSLAEDKFARNLPFPISTTMPIQDQIAALTANIGELSAQKRRNIER